MSKSKITIYKQNPDKNLLLFHEDKNFIVDDLEEYLESRCDKIVQDECQYLKIKLDLDVKLSLFTQTYSHLLHSEPLYYVKIEEDDEIFYYFIRDFEWLSENSVRLKLHLDVLNTLKLGTDYIFGGETIVQRQHYDRYLPDRVNGELIRDINVYPESINAPFYKTSESTIYDADLHRAFQETSFDLIFKNQEDPEQVVNSPILVYLLADEPLYIEGDQDKSDWPSSLVNINSGTYATGGVFVIENHYLSTRNNKFAIWIQGRGEDPSSVVGINTYDENGNVTESATSPYWNEIQNIDPFCFALIEFTSSGIDAVLYYGLKGDQSTYDYYEFNRAPYIGIRTGINHTDPESVPACDYDGELIVDSNDDIDDLIVYLDNHIQSERTFSFIWDQLNSLSDINRTDTKFVKILKLPYSPGALQSVAGTGLHARPLGWEVTTMTQETTTANGKTKEEELTVLQPDDILSPLTHRITMDQSDSSPVNKLKLSITSDELTILSREKLDLTNSIHCDLESKIFDSEYQYDKVVYDSFSYIIKYQDVVYDAKDESDLAFDYRVSTTSNTVISNTFNGWEKRYQGEDYDSLMIVKRNNDVPLYSSDYLNYLMSGYNYDVKSRGLSALQSVTSVFTNMFDPGKLANRNSMISGAVRGLTSTIFGALEAENSLAKTLSEKSYSTESIAGSDDLDILETYTNSNKYKLIHYEIRDFLKSLLVKYFQLTGYATSFYGSPDLDSRSSFNYAQIEPDFEYFRYISRDVIDELESKWRGGVFKLHHFNNNWDDGLDLTNIENSLLKD